MTYRCPWLIFKLEECSRCVFKASCHYGRDNPGGIDICEDDKKTLQKMRDEQK